VEGGHQVREDQTISGDEGQNFDPDPDPDSDWDEGAKETPRGATGNRVAAGLGASRFRGVRGCMGHTVGMDH
jgi:hypothetical protein